jgi:hypothetical protein
MNLQCTSLRILKIYFCNCYAANETTWEKEMDNFVVIYDDEKIKKFI